MVNGLLGIERADSNLILISSPFLLFREMWDIARGLVAGGLRAAGADFATGNDNPLNFPRLATPTPHVN